MRTKKPERKRLTYKDFYVSSSGTLDIQRQGFTSFEGITDSHELTVLFCRMLFFYHYKIVLAKYSIRHFCNFMLEHNPITCFEGFPVYTHLSELYMNNTHLKSLKGLQRQPRIRKFDFTGTPFAKQKYANLMGLLVLLISLVCSSISAQFSLSHVDINFKLLYF